MMQKMIFQSMLSAVLKVAAAFVSFALTYIVARELNILDAGYFLFCFALVSIFSMLFRLGLNDIILRVFGANGLSGYANDVLSKSIQWIFISSLLFSFIVFTFSDFISATVFSKAGMKDSLIWMMFSVPPICLYSILGMAFQGIHRVTPATLFQTLFHYSLFLIVLYVYLSTGDFIEANSSLFAKIFFITSLITLLASWLWWFRNPQARFGIQPLLDKDLWTSSSNLWSATIMSLAVQWAAVLIAGIYLESEDLALLTTAQRTSILVSFVLLVIGPVVAPRIARYWSEKKMAEIQRLSILSTRAMIFLVLPLALVMIFWSKSIMALFGDDFSQASYLLAIMVLGQLVNVSTGVVGYLLNMTGHEVDYRIVSLFAGMFSILISFIFTWQWGAIGAASAIAIGLSVQNIGAMYMVKKRLGFWTIG
jgi:O-antigen/teichoic acid export membrane protein